MNNCFAISPLDGRYSNKLDELRSIVSEYGLIKYRLIVEIKWFKFLCSIIGDNINKIQLNEEKLLDDIINNFNEAEYLKIKKIESVTFHDVKAVEYYLKDKVKNNKRLYELQELIHFMVTSEDINNLAYALMIKDSLSVLYKYLDSLLLSIQEKAISYKNLAMLARTHGQVASPTTLGKELYNFFYRIKTEKEHLQNIQILGKLNGAVGCFNAHIISYPDIDWIKATADFVESLGLFNNMYTTQIEPHDFMINVFNYVSHINSICLDFAKDMWGYIAINYFKQNIHDGEVGSSVMPHKVNPIDFENAEGNLGLANAIANFFANKLAISRWQRDLSDSTVLRNIGSFFAYTILSYQSLLVGISKVEANTEAINVDLDNNYEVLGEAIQTIMRKHGIKNSYEQLKKLTRGKKINQDTLKGFINNLQISDYDKEKLLSLTPHNYIGLASKLVK